MKKSINLTALILILAMLVGCGSNPSTPAGNTGSDNNASGNNASGTVKDSVTITLDADIATLDPMQSASTQDLRVYLNIYDTLITKGASDDFEPALAEKWDVSDDGKTYTFHLRKGIKFHNGEELKASDVVYTFTIAKSSPYLEGQLIAVKDAVAVDDYTVDVHLNYAYSPFLLSIYDQLYIVNEKAVTEGGETYGEHPVGTGPYKFVEHEVGKRVVLESFADYYKGEAAIKNVVFKVITDTNTSLIALETGDVDFAYEIPMISAQSVSDNKDLTAYEVDSIQLTYVLMNTGKEPFNNKLLRQALNYAIDKDTIIQVAEEGMGTKTNSMLSKDIFGYSEEVKGYEYNPEKAKELLAQAGYADGLVLTFKTMDGTYKKAAELIQENLRAVGVTVNIEIEEKNAYIQDLVSGNYEIGNISVSVGKDADFYSLIVRTGEQANFSKYSNEEVDKLFAEGREEGDSAKRLEIYKNVIQLLNDEAVIVPLYYPVNLCASRAGLNVGAIDPQSYTHVYDMSWK